MTTKEKILSVLQGGELLSGQVIAQRLGLSRAAVCKAVAGLAQEGYVFEAATKRGYRLLHSPDVLSLGAVLPYVSACPWASYIQVLPSTDSTNNALKTLAADGAPEGTVLIAEEQTAGRGRRGRQFASPKGLGIYLSALIRPHCPPGELLELTALTAVAVRRAIRRLTGAAPDIKWVNDLQLNERKLCGILTELSIEAESSHTDYAVIGIGINCNEQYRDFPPELQGTAGSVCSETGQRVDRNRLAAYITQELYFMRQALSGGRLAYMDEYRKACLTIGMDIEILQGDTAIPAKALDVGAQGELLVRYADGTEGAVCSGEVSVRGLNHYF